MSQTRIFASKREVLDNHLLYDDVPRFMIGRGSRCFGPTVDSNSLSMSGVLRLYWELRTCVNLDVLLYRSAWGHPQRHLKQSYMITGGLVHALWPWLISSLLGIIKGSSLPKRLQWTRCPITLELCRMVSSGLQPGLTFQAYELHVSASTAGHFTSSHSLIS